MTTSVTERPTPVLRRLDSEGATVLLNLSATFEDLQTVLRCCEQLVAALSSDTPAVDDLVIESLWTTALASYARSFTSAHESATLTQADLSGIELTGDVQEWHTLLLTLYAHYTSATVNPREIFSVGVAQDDAGEAEGIAITGARQPLVEDLAVRQTGRITLALSDLLNERIIAQQKKVFGQLKDTPKVVLDKLPLLEVADV